MTLTTQFITFNIPLGNGESDLVGQVESVLAERGEPLRWAITQVNADTQIATVEAVVTTVS